MTPVRKKNKQVGRKVNAGSHKKIIELFDVTDDTQQEVIECLNRNSNLKIEKKFSYSTGGSILRLWYSYREEILW